MICMWFWFVVFVKEFFIVIILDEELFLLNVIKILMLRVFVSVYIYFCFV